MLRSNLVCSARPETGPDIQRGRRIQNLVRQLVIGYLKDVAMASSGPRYRQQKPDILSER